MAEDGAAQGVGVGARRGRGRRFVVALAVTAIAAWLTSGSAPHAAPLAADSDWRWESYGGIEVQVPADWGHRMSPGQWCEVRENGASFVGRNPMAFLAHACRTPPPPNPPDFLLFDSHLARGEGVEAYDGYVLETRTVDGVRVTVFTDDAELRDQILDSARAVPGRDSYGCAQDSPIADDASWRPDPGPGGLSTVGDVESVSICRYTVAGADPPPPGERPDREPLLSASSLTGDDAQHLIDAIVAAPEGTGPDYPSACGWQGPGAPPVSETMLLEVHGTQRTQLVVLTYEWCEGIGTDDGHTVRQLTPEIAKTVLEGPHHPSSLTAPVVWWLHPETAGR